MTFDLYLIAAPEIDAGALEMALERAPAAVLLIGADADQSDETYLDRVKTLAKIAQARDCAVLLDNRAHLVRKAGADGVHMSGGIKALKEALAELKPDFIVGTGDIGSRHEAMLRGELDIDYVMFGDRADIDGAEMAQWWAETFEVPAVWRINAAEAEPGRTGAEFVAVPSENWDGLSAVSKASAP